MGTEPKSRLENGSGKPGAGRDAPTINDVAALAGVSKKTVSRFINDSPLISQATRDKVSAAIDSLGYVPNPQARALALRRNFMIALLHDNPNAQTVLNFQRGVLSAISDSDLALAVRPVDRTSDVLLDDISTFLGKQRPLGVLILPPISERDDIAQLCQDMDIPYIRVGSAPLDMPERCVASNDREIVRDAVSRLVARGHKRIGFVRGPDNFRSAVEREAGFRDALEGAGIDLVDALYTKGNYRFASGMEAGQALLDLPDRPTAIFVSNDEMAAGVMHAAYDRKLAIPEDLAIVGFDDSPTARHTWPQLSTVLWPIEEMGRIAALKLVPGFLSERPDKDVLETVILPSDLVERGSAKL